MKTLATDVLKPFELWKSMSRFCICNEIQVDAPPKCSFIEGKLTECDLFLCPLAVPGALEKEG